MLGIESGVRKMYKKIEKYFSKHVYVNSFAHLLIGVGVGILITNSFVNPHPLRYGLALVAIGVLIHFYAYFQEK
ncbi:MAG: hypothetical protein M1405_00515 [Patescibacteria group bacterium]|nr:hypothetical protein [Patescibacteria group bacterium]